MPIWICATCGNHYPDQESPPPECVICADERQWVPPSGQRWTTAAELAAAGHRSDIRQVEPGLRLDRGMVEAVRPYRFDRIYGGWWQPVLRTGAREILEESADRYIEFVRGDVAVD